MNITRKSLITGVERTFDLPVTEEQIQAWKDGTFIKMLCRICRRASGSFS